MSVSGCSSLQSFFFSNMFRTMSFNFWFLFCALRLCSCRPSAVMAKRLWKCGSSVFLSAKLLVLSTGEMPFVCGHRPVGGGGLPFFVPLACSFSPAIVVSFIFCDPSLELSPPFSLRPNMPVSLVFIDGLDKGGAGRFKSSATGAFVVTLPFGMEVSEVLPSCEYVDADDADALDCGTIVRAFFFGLEGVAVCVDMTRIGGAATVQRKRGRAETSSLAAWGQRPLGGEYRRRLRIA